MTEDRSMSTLELELEVALRDLGAALAVPAAPGLAERVRVRIEAERPRRAAPRWWLPLVRAAGIEPGPRRSLRRSVLLAAAAILLIAAAVTAAIGYGLPGIRILFGPPPSIAPTTPAATGSAPLPTPLAPGATLGLGAPVTLEVARDQLDFEILLPADPAIGPPDAVYLATRRVALAWGPDDALPGTTQPGLGLLLIELRATVDEATIEKLVSSGTVVEEVTVDGAPGYWIAGQRHFFAYIEPDGTRIDDSLREVGSTLVWTRDGITYRLEGELTRDEAVELASSLR
ncbi:MAG: DUF4367 domain-containing protein [Chloroflexi bacterium]|nr:DUF4367 domain-containing protein [Chloroflexota bacterium]